MEQKLKNRGIAIQLINVKKMYKLGQVGGGTLQADLQSWWAKKRGKEDPNTKIGQRERLVGQTFMALNGIDLTVYKGEALGIIGGNGAGKSTMLKLLSRVTAPTSGKIDLYGRIASMLEVGTGFNGEMTGRENVYMNGAILGMTKAEIDEKMEDIIEFSEVREFIDTPVKRYSSGMYVKLAFSVAAHLDSEIMIMDEVLAVGDMAFQKKCLEKMRDVANKEGRTVLYVSHNMNTIRQLCDRCIVLDKGQIVFEGGVEEGIGVYLNNPSEQGNYLNLSNFERSPYLPKKNIIRFTSCEYVGFEKKEDQNNLKIYLSWNSLDCNDDLQFRVEFSINGLGIAATVTETKVNIEKEKTVLNIDTSMLIPATYDVILVAYREINNSSIDVDIVKLLPYKKALDRKVFNNWNKGAWGYIKIPNIQLLESNLDRNEELDD